ncbi:MAG: hypothetical protein MdMp014T_0861 [Treponematales bacterium]
MSANVHTQAIPQAVLTEAQAKIDEVLTSLSPYLMALTPEQRRELPKMGRKTLDFVEKAYDFARQNTGLVPPYLNLTEFGVDFADAHGLWTLLNSVQQLEQGIDDTEMAAGSEAYQTALVFYHSVKLAAGNGISGAKAVYEELKTRFPQRGRRASEETGEQA